MRPFRVLVVDSDTGNRLSVRTLLGTAGYRTEDVGSGAEALTHTTVIASARGPDLVVLELLLPDIEGLEVIARIRQRSWVPIVVLSSRRSQRTAAAALDLGADDFITRPFGEAEFLARLRCAMRHRLVQLPKAAIVRGKGLWVNGPARLVTVGGRTIHLQPREFDLLSLLIAHRGKVLTWTSIMDRLWPRSAPPQHLRACIYNLRRKLELDPNNPRHIITVHGTGYRFQQA